MSLASTLALAKPSLVADNLKEEAHWKKWSQALIENNRALRLEDSDSVRSRCVRASCTTEFDIFLNALSTAYGDQALSKAQLNEWLQWADKQPLSKEERAHLAWTFRSEVPHLWMTAKEALLLENKQAQLTNRRLSARFKQMLIYTQAEFAPIPPDTNRVQLARDLVSHNPPIDKYGDGSYAKGVRIFMFCRDDRSYPCLMIMKNASGVLVKKNGKLWTNKSLGFSRLEKTYDEVNGHTPAGVFLIDGVMPTADQQQLFGKFRRFVLNFPEVSEDEEYFKYLLPASSHDAKWWSEGRIARDMGRGLFRVHGTLRPAPKGTTYFPFLGTAGCVAQRENKYNGIEYKDQRHLLDDVMKTMGLPAVYDNETQIRGLLYVMNIDGKQKAVELSDLQGLQIVP